LRFRYFNIQYEKYTNDKKSQNARGRGTENHRDWQDQSDICDRQALIMRYRCIYIDGSIKMRESYYRANNIKRVRGKGVPGLARRREDDDYGSCAKADNVGNRIQLNAKFLLPISSFNPPGYGPVKQITNAGNDKKGYAQLYIPVQRAKATRKRKYQP